LSWVVTDIFCPPFSNRLFDVVVIASAIQYFKDLAHLLQAIIPLLTTGGEIHILDSPLYSAGELPAARDRSRRYYEELGYPEMASYYHHHTLTSIAPHNPQWLYVPQSGNRSNSFKDSPFPWICLRPGC
jgi:ubiquinone/menaquinone biosynthesis C-methylase UbiE